jgi:phosphatidylinositol glycan class Q protein
VTWTAAVVDMVMGAVAGVLVVQHQSWITRFVQRMMRMLTNDILHTGCIWLMGMPDGFKDNDELATRIGTLWLHVI